MAPEISGVFFVAGCSRASKSRPSGTFSDDWRHAAIYVKAIVRRIIETPAAAYMTASERSMVLRVAKNCVIPFAPF